MVYTVRVFDKKTGDTGGLGDVEFDTGRFKKYNIGHSDI